MTRLTVLLLLLLLSGCGAPTRNALLRRDAADAIAACGSGGGLRRVPYLQRYGCIQYVRDWCARQGLERDCGE